MQLMWATDANHDDGHYVIQAATNGGGTAQLNKLENEEYNYCNTVRTLEYIYRKLELERLWLFKRSTIKYDRWVQLKVLRIELRRSKNATHDISYIYS